MDEALQTKLTAWHTNRRASQRRRLGRLGRRPARGRPYRWLAWAEALSARHGRLTMRPDPTNFTLAHPMSLLSFVRERVLVSSRSFFPRVHLAIQPILERTIGRGLFEAAHASHAATLQNRSRPASSTWDERRFAAQTVFLSTTPPERSAHDRITLSGQRVVEGFVKSLREVVAASTRDAHAPLHLVFQRLERADELMVVRTNDKLTRESLETLVNRVHQRVGRVEERLDQQPALITRRTPAAAIARQDSSVLAASGRHTPDEITRVSAQPGDWTRGNPQSVDWARGGAQAPALNIDQLTEQVMRQLDRRVVAARERMGKI